MSVWRQTGVKPKELDELVEMPDCFAECWFWFLRLNARRTGTGFGANPIQYSEIKSFFDLEGYEPMAWEVQMIEQFDNTFLQVMNENLKKEQQQSKSKSKSK